MRLYAMKSTDARNPRRILLGFGKSPAEASRINEQMALAKVVEDAAADRVGIYAKANAVPMH
jgi:hypothetical protein